MAFVILDSVKPDGGNSYKVDDRRQSYIYRINFSPLFRPNFPAFADSPDVAGIESVYTRKLLKYHERNYRALDHTGVN